MLSDSSLAGKNTYPATQAPHSVSARLTSQSDPAIFEQPEHCNSINLWSIYHINQRKRKTYLTRTHQLYTN